VRCRGVPASQCGVWAFASALSDGIRGGEVEPCTPAVHSEVGVALLGLPACCCLAAAPPRRCLRRSMPAGKWSHGPLASALGRRRMSLVPVSSAQPLVLGEPAPTSAPTISPSDARSPYELQLSCGAVIVDAPKTCGLVITDVTGAGVYDGFAGVEIARSHIEEVLEEELRRRAARRSGCQIALFGMGKEPDWILDGSWGRTLGRVRRCRWAQVGTSGSGASWAGAGARATCAPEEKS